MSLPDNDLLHGVPAIAVHLSMTTAQVYHLHDQGRLPTFRMGRTVCARKSTLAAHFAALEAGAAPKGADDGR